MSQSNPIPSQTAIPFTPPGTSKQCETAAWVYGDLDEGHVPLIALHGGPGSPSPYLTPLALLHQKHGIPVVLYDQLGCGASTRLPETRGSTDFWTIDLFLAELKNLIAHLGIQQYDLLGHSWGGMLVGSFALTQPRGLRKLIVYSSPARFQKRVDASLRQRSAFPTDMRVALERGDEDEHFKSSKQYQAAVMHFNRTHMCRLDPWPQAFVDSITLMNQDDTVSSTLYPGGLFN
ncbi:hypothetical protein B0A55_13264 [Friedmanniomyces simplex]|uniref:AB hydrolase-1 domain-containing protein n=1 Tax=Friedmanniomyces simplex TaxID=329884 RepID=A0A4U0VLF0_9PEZI|nr:hypothetical protein B0A55_13264 [Friedmanniomyces simplex]